MKTEKPILFSAPMVRAILENRKTQTRRIVEPQPERWISSAALKCPYPVGTRLWVKETFMHEPAEYELSLSGTHPFRKACTIYRADISNGGEKGAGWKPSIFMPRRLSRITLEVTKVRVERLQEISEDDAKEEGCFFQSGGWDCCVLIDGWFRECEGHSTPRNAYRHLWESINGPDSWNANPFVWAYDFRRVET